MKISIILTTAFINDVSLLSDNTPSNYGGTLSSLLTWAGEPTTIQSAEKILTTEVPNKMGLFVIPLLDFKSVLQEISEGHPVLLVDDDSIFSLAVGYNVYTETIITTSGSSAYRNRKFSEIRHLWKQKKISASLVLPPHKLSASASEQVQAAAAMKIEKAGHIKNAEKAYKEILKRWPKNFVSKWGLETINSRRNTKSKIVLR